MSDQPSDTPRDAPDDAAWGYASPGETRWPAAFSILAVMVLQLLLPEKLTVGPWWMVPGMEASVLTVLLIANPSKLDEESKILRIVALGLTGILISANSITLGLLIHHLLHEGDATNGRTLIYSGVAVWFTAVAAFGILYWELDRGGPVKRRTIDHARPDFLFAQMDNPALSGGRWWPRFFDYLYLSLTNSTAFSPTDALPLTLRAKLFMAVQSLASLGTIAIVGARAVNILK
jgi:hypothetical protein